MRDNNQLTLFHLSILILIHIICISSKQNVPLCLYSLYGFFLQRKNGNFFIFRFLCFGRITNASKNPKSSIDLWFYFLLLHFSLSLNLSLKSLSSMYRIDQRFSHELNKKKPKEKSQITAHFVLQMFEYILQKKEESNACTSPRYLNICLSTTARKGSDKLPRFKSFSSSPRMCVRFIFSILVVGKNAHCSKPIIDTVNPI